MDADKRHQLKQNELAEALTKLRHFGSDRQTQYWLIGIAVVLVAYLGYHGWSRWQVERQTSAWRELSDIGQKIQNNTPNGLDELREVIKSSSNATVAATARIDLAAALREKARDSKPPDAAALQEAVETLKPLLDQSGTPPALVGAAGLSLATTYESLHQFDDAERTYNILMDKNRFAGTAYPALAAQRLKTLPELRQPIEFTAGMPLPEASPAALGPSVVGPPAPPVITITPPGEAPIPVPTLPPVPPAGQTPAKEPAGETPGGESPSEAPATQPSGNTGP